ncbi:hypothetical protein BMI86_14635 [Thioclava sp. DLFJ5-1]|uniref:glycosyltransferase family 2 protein n=1 Tax=Thioclava sp. DLFJ5-1 TaxID=1915314 RepID=UPI0009C498CB|nr:glycosyltransferase [Thioclava sp. DLFJ5-1]OOY19846.1 hypothetical protein BMI86_14635 [Thioclava sp. DLFJ5-1]
MAERITVIMANWCGASYLAAAIASLRRQTVSDWRLIISDDGSDDDSVAIAQDFARQDPRIEVLTVEKSSGPATARNRALERAKGEWVAILDSDDLMHPERLERMLEGADALGADVIADDMVFFGTVPGSGGRTLLEPMSLVAPLEITAKLWVEAAAPETELPPLGYLKPMIRRAILGDLRYDPDLRIGEDFDFVLRLLLKGAKFCVLPDPMYLYRRHNASISHRLSSAAIGAMIRAQQRLSEGLDPAVAAQLAARHRGLRKMADFEALVANLKARQFSAAAIKIARRPSLAQDVLRSLAERRKGKDATGPERRAVQVSLGAEEGADVLADEIATASVAEKMHVSVPKPVAPGAMWASPPAKMAAKLSALSEANDVIPEALDGAGAWARWLLPQWAQEQA